MNTKSWAGIIIAIVIVIGIGSALSFNEFFSENNDTETASEEESKTTDKFLISELNDTETASEEESKTTGKVIILELKESISASAKP